MQNVTTSPAAAIQDITALMALDLPVLMLGQPGVGKSDIARAVARNLGGGFIDFRGTLMDAVDLHGLPVADKEAGKAIWLPSALMPDVERDGETGVILVDEIDKCAPDMQAAMLGFILDRRIGDYELPAGWKIIAAGNRMDDRAGGRRLSSALCNRFVHITLEPSVDDWVTYAIDAALPPVLIAFMRLRPELLNDFDPARQINATPRSWEMAAKIMAGPDLPEDVEGRLIMGTVGEGAGAEFLGFLKTYRDLPNPDVCLMNPETAMVPETSAGRFAIASAVANRVNEASMENFKTYISRLPAEFGVMAMRDATRRDAELANTFAFIQYQEENKDVYV